MRPRTGDVSTHRLTLGPEERWILHHTLLDYIELEQAAAADTRPLDTEIALLRRIESGELSFTDGELYCLRGRCESALRDRCTPERDRAALRTVLDELTRCLA